jgi:hypothetical protein
MSKIIYNNEARVHIFSAGQDELMRLYPGRNNVEDDIHAKIEKSSDSFRQAIEDGTVTVVGDAIKMSALDQKQAIELVEMEATVDGVQELLKQESRGKKRKPVIEAATAKITAIKQAEASDNEAKEKAKVKGAGATGGGAGKT